MGLNEDEKKLLAELLEREKQPEQNTDFEIEIYDTAANKGARIPYSQGKGWLKKIFDIGDDEAPATGGTAPAGEGGAGGDAPPPAPPEGRGYFGRK